MERIDELMISMAEPESVLASYGILMMYTFGDYYITVDSNVYSAVEARKKLYYSIFGGFCGIMSLNILPKKYGWIYPTGVTCYIVTDVVLGFF
jgi:hypothetical protein